MPARELPARPDLDHLKNEAKSLLRAFQRGDPDAQERIISVFGAVTAPKLTDAQRVIAREYGFASWVKLRSHVQSTRGLVEATDEFLSAVEAEDRDRAGGVLRAQPGIVSASPHVAAVLGRVDELKSILARDLAAVHALAGPHHPAESLHWLCFSPFHGVSLEYDEGLAACLRVLLDAGADPNSGGMPALYAVTGHRNVPRIARMLLEAGANPTDGESAFHAAEHFHLEALELLREFGVDLNYTGEWGNTPLYFLLHWWDVESTPDVKRGLLWLLSHGADPNVRCGKERESSLHVAVRRRQHPDIIRTLLDHGADVHARRGDGRTPWVLARRAGIAAVTTLLERAGAAPEPLSVEDRLLEACGRGDVDGARTLGTAPVVAGASSELRQLLHDAARRGELPVVRACLAAGLSADAADESGTTALHHASIEGHSAIVAALLAEGADFDIRDNEHHGTPLAWACFGADFHDAAGADYEGCVRALLKAGSRLTELDHRPKHLGVVQVLRELGIV